ncbi:MAG: cob(I)yrinic acid a,c-diamide adenosyltransferase [Christensenellaceae bacterium]|nr:cob(I)yrinic acid a,c-diamide adenosyltransferase [Christensenellaceae bacterium]
MIHIYFGSGKGKTTAATGLAVRAKGAGMNVVVAQFLKAMPSSEIVSLGKLGISVLRGELPLYFSPDYTAEDIRKVTDEHNKLFARAVSFTQPKTLIVLDELLDAYALGYIDREAVLSYLKNLPENIEVILTGHSAAEEILSLADYISEIIAHRHPFDKGVQARRGIEF